MNLSSRQIPTLPHQFGKLAEIVREELAEKYSVWLMSAQPSRSVALLQEHDCPAQFVPNSKDYPAIDKLQNGRTRWGLNTQDWLNWKDLFCRPSGLWSLPIGSFSGSIAFPRPVTCVSVVERLPSKSIRISCGQGIMWCIAATALASLKS